MGKQELFVEGDGRGWRMAQGRFSFFSDLLCPQKLQNHPLLLYRLNVSIPEKINGNFNALSTC